MQKLKVIITFLSICLFHLAQSISSEAIIAALGAGYKVYNPLWSVKENNGALPLNTLAPYQLSRGSKTKKRNPVVLIHGVISDSKPYCNWSFLLKQIEEQKHNGNVSLDDVYIYRYPSAEGNWRDLTNNLNQGLRELMSDYPPDSKLKLVVSSLGGVLLCDATLNDKYLNDKIIKGVSLGTPFWGTPLLKEDWSVGDSSGNKTFNWLLFKSTNLFFPSLSERLAWIPPMDEHTTSLDRCAHLRGKLINYGAFSQSPLTTDAKSVKHKEITDWVLNKVKTSDYRHSWNALMHYKIGWEILQQIPKPMYLLSYNDGLVPIYSSLWLDPEKERFVDQTELTPEVLHKIKQLNPHARLFKGVDHSDYTRTDGQTSSNQFFDMLNEINISIAQAVLSDLR